MQSLYVRSLTLTQFRNYTELSLAFCEGINCLTGPNGAGKTNILDALHVMALTRSLRNAQDALAIQDGAPFFLVQAEVVRADVARQVQCNCVKGRGKQVIVNGKKIKSADYFGQVPLISVLPNDTDLINGPAADRRLMVDMLLSQYDPLYLSHLSHYTRIVEQRNALLRHFADTATFDRDQLELWDMQLVPHGIYLLSARLAFVEEFLPLFRDFFAQIVSGSETPDLVYQPSVADNTPVGWRTALAQCEAKDRVLARTGAGIHRDDVVFSIDSTSVRNYGSQGQQKTFVIALKLAEYRLLQARTRTAPILLLDDVFDKLDETRLAQIASILNTAIEGQVFITDTSHERLAKVFSGHKTGKTAFFAVNDGGVEAK